MTAEIAKWIIVAIAIGTLIFNTGILWNDVKHLKEDVKAIRQLLDDILKKIKI